MSSRALRTLVVITFGLGFGIPSASAQPIYWTEYGNGRILRADVSAPGEADEIASGLTAPLGLALDAIGGKLYWAEETRIQRANLDGTGLQELIPDLTSPVNIVLDTCEGRVYWTEAGMVRRARLSGRDVETVFSGPALGGLALDSSTRQLYVSTTLGLILRMNLDGSNVETVVDLTIDSSPVGMALDSDGGKIYWIEAFPFPKLGRANLDGSNVEFVVLTALDSFGIALDVGAGKMYYSSDGIIHRANLDGSNVEELIVTGKEGPNGIALYLAPTMVRAALDIQPGPCPNSINVRSHGVVHAAVAGTESLDVNRIDVTSLVLSRSDGVGGGVAPTLWGQQKTLRMGDVATPFCGGPSICADGGPDGVVDLVLRFATDEMVESMLLDAEPNKAEIAFTLSGMLLDGTPFEAMDVILASGKK